MTDRMRQFKNACRAYFAGLSLVDLRSYGREIGVSRPTAKKKDALIEDAIAILAEELEPIPVSKQGAPVKNDRVDERIPARIAELKKEFFSNMVTVPSSEKSMEARIKKLKEEGGVPLVLAGSGELEDNFFFERELTGQVYESESGYRLLPLDCEDGAQEIMIPNELIAKRRVREGDVLVCKTLRAPQKLTQVAQILSINDGLWINSVLDRPKFDECAVCAPRERIRLSEVGREQALSLKLVEWLLPFAKGQRACLISPPKAGKTQLLLQIAKALTTTEKELETYVLLVEQSPEAIGDFQNVLPKERLFYTTYEDEPERQVLLADFLLQRAKRRAELGKDVLIIVDSLSALARAYNDTDASSGGKTLSCGLEIKTMRYLKKYFGAARCFEKGGSLTLVGAVSAQTGNPMDEVISAELSAQANYELRLSHELAMRRIYPAVDFISSSITQGESFRSQREISFDGYLRSEGIAKLGVEGLLRLLAQSNSYKQFMDAVEKEVE